MGKWQILSLIQAQPAQLAMLGIAQTRFAPPSRDHKDVVLTVAMCGRVGFVENGDLFEGLRADPYLLVQLSQKGGSRRLTLLAVPADDVPHSWIELAILSALGQ